MKSNLYCLVRVRYGAILVRTSRTLLCQLIFSYHIISHFAVYSFWCYLNIVYYFLVVFVQPFRSYCNGSVFESRKDSKSGNGIKNESLIHFIFGIWSKSTTVADNSRPERRGEDKSNVNQQQEVKESNYNEISCNKIRREVFLVSVLEQHRNEHRLGSINYLPYFRDLHIAKSKKKSINNRMTYQFGWRLSVLSQIC